MGSKNKRTCSAFIQAKLDEVKALIVDMYLLDKQSIDSIHQKLIKLGVICTHGQVSYAIHRYGLCRTRNAKSPVLLEALKNRVQSDKFCSFCKKMFCPTSPRQKYCTCCCTKAISSRRIKNYGIGECEVNNMYLLQNFACAICNVKYEEELLVVDHNHRTGKVRGLLCRKCNLNLHVIENELYVKNAIAYLNKHE